MTNQELIVQINVDTQNDFCPGGKLGVEEGDQVVAPLNRLGRFVRRRSGLVVFTKDYHPLQTGHFDRWPVHCVAGTKGAELHPDLVIKPNDVTILKGTLPSEDAYSGFDAHDDEGRSLEEIILTAAETKEIKLLIGGLATDYCVKATVLDGLCLQSRQKALGRTVKVCALTDAMRAVNLQPGDGQKALEEMQAAGAILATTKDIVARAVLNQTGVMA